MDAQVSILGFAGSLRKGSCNRALLRAAVELVPDGARLEAFELDGIPAFNGDLESSPPEKVKEFKRRIRAADAVLIVTPEYNYSVPGVLKNAIDWASRPHGDNSFEGKPEVFVTFAHQKFDDEGKLLDKQTKELIGELLGNLVAWTRRLKTA